MPTERDAPPSSPAFAPRVRRRGACWDWLGGPLLALQFLTVLPVPVPAAPEEPQSAAPPDAARETAPDMARALPWFPLVGALLGLLLVAVDRALAPILARDVRDALLLAIPALLTGMLHLDGFADSCDGLLGTRTVARRLEILRDSGLGAYGVAGLALLLILRYAALGALPEGGRAAALVAAPLLGRWAMVYAVVRYPYARPAGAGSSFRGRGRHLALASLLTLALLCGAVLLFAAHRPSGATALPAVGVALGLGGGLALLSGVIALLWCRWASQRLGGGLTGDTYGALNELVELAVLLAVSPLLLALGEG